MPITFSREFILSQLSLAISAKNGVVDDRVQHEIENRKRSRDSVTVTRDAIISALSKIDYAAKPDDVRRAVGAVYGQYPHGFGYLLQDLATDAQIEAETIRVYSHPMDSRAKSTFIRAAETLKASNTASLTFNDLKNLGITGIERFEVKEIEAADDSDGVTPHTEE